ncbi:uncharacterized protein gnu [Eurosta solidaginis]|uniref:uncharacterized protein gnu n=1 Tax=Eurosta solidaginis TaxID=178769 RepID=UPI003530EABB
MHPFSRAYRDPRSPLTPLTPLSENTSFTFNISSDDTLKPFMKTIESHEAKENCALSPCGIISSVKYVNPSKYIKSAQAKNTLSESTVNAKRLSPRFASTKNSKSKIASNDKITASDYGSNESNCFIKADKSSPKYASTINSLKVKRNSFNSANLDIASGSSSNDSNYSGWTSCSSQSDTSRRRSICDSGAFRSDSKFSFASNASVSSTSSKGGSPRTGKDTGRHIPPKLVLNDAKEDNGATMPSIFDWVWNQLSPIHNLTIYELLTRVGMQKYWEIFKREEILDLDVFSTLTLNDLKTIGIKNSNDCLKILESVRMALDFLSGLLVFKKP